MKEYKDTAPVREGEELDQAALSEYLRGRIDGIENGMEILQFPSGNSNLTYVLRIGDLEYVLRRAPLGPVPPRAHDMVREYHLLKKLHPVFPLAPGAILLCEDPEIIGAPFYLMERRHGIVLFSQLPGEIGANPGIRRRISGALVECLAELHSIDIHATGLVSIGKPDGFLERHLEGWIGRWYRAETEPAPEMNEVVEWLKASRPISGAPSLIHNDFRLENVMLDRENPDRITAVLDWEMATVGDPLVDLGLTLCYWLRAPNWRESAMDADPGWFSREEFLLEYGKRTGFDLSQIAWYEVFGVFKLAVIVRQIYFRYLNGQTHNPRFSSYDGFIRSLVKGASDLVREAR